MNPSFEQALVEVWRQALVENAKAVKVGGESYPVRRTPKRGLRQVSDEAGNRLLLRNLVREALIFALLGQFLFTVAFFRFDMRKKTAALGFPAGLVLWVFYRFVGFAVKG